MSHVLLTLLSLVLYLNRRVTLARMVWTYHNDLSEHCRRRVMPSVFLGEQVIDSNSQMLHFGPLELPYSCFITVRTEAGNNIILVISLSSEETLKTSCRSNSDQLLVFEMGETYGGYWGPLSNRLLHANEKETLEDTNTIKQYTLETTHKPIVDRNIMKKVTTEKQEEDKVEPEKPTKTPRKRTTTTKEDNFVIEVPIVEVSVHQEPAKEVFQSPSQDDFDETFDLLNDVMPRPDESYHSTIIPIVQLSMEKDSGQAGDQPRFQFNYNLDQGDFYRRRYNTIKTTRLRFFQASLPFQRKKLLKSKTTTMLNKRTRQSKRPRYPTHSYRYTSNNRPLVSMHKPSHSFQNKHQDNEPQLTSNDRSTETAGTTHTRPDSWQHVVDLMNNMKSMTDDGENVDQENNDTISDVKEKVSDMKHNMSIYLEPDLDIYAKDGKSEIHSPEQSVGTKFNISMFTRTPLKLGSTTVPFSTYLKPKSSISKVTQIRKESVTTVEKGDIKLSDKTNDTKSTTSTTNEDLFLSQEHEVLINATKHVSENKMDYENYSEEEENQYSRPNVEIRLNSNPRQEMSREQQNLMEKLNQIHYNNYFLQTTTTLEANKSTNNFGASKETVEPISGTTVDHESWENVVQAAPRIAKVLNQTATQEDDSLKSVRKRNVESIPIVNAKPHGRTTTKTIDIQANRHNGSDAVTFASLIEPIDDEMHGRIDLRHILKFVGPVYFNICENQEAKVRQVKLFNSSKIVLALMNFTLDQMILVTTTAHRLSSSNLLCPASHLECQIEGKRVCIDSNCACDNVPNCGSYDIYDEDRLQCGGDNNQQHYVYLAGFTFISVILTMLYTVLYWLKRCVPRVSEAFFVYTAGTENVLYLDSVMRSPTDIDNTSRLVYNSDFLEDDLMLDETEEKSFFRKMFGLCYAIRRWRSRRGSSAEIMGEQSEVRKMYSFAQLELKKMSQGQSSWDKSVQTGESLEITELYEKSAKKEIAVLPKQTEKPRVGNVEDEESSPDFGEILNIMNITRQKYENDDLKELKMLKVLKDARVSKSSSDSTQSQTIYTLTSGQSSRLEETEMHTTDYDKPSIELQSVEKTKPSNMTRTPQNIQSRKRLRFQKEAIAIPSTSFLDDDEEDEVPDALTNRRQSVMLGPTARRVFKGLGKIEEDSGQALANTALDFKRFWSKKTGSKKKPNVSKRK